MRARDLMTPDAAWIDPHAAVSEAARRLAAGEALCLLVGTPDGPPRGIVTSVDVLRAAVRTALRAQPRPGGYEKARVCDLPRESLFDVLARDARGTAVSEVMSSPVHAVEEDASACEIMDVLLRRRIESVPVVRGERVLGMVHRRTVLGRLAGAMADRKDAA